MKASELIVNPVLGLGPEYDLAISITPDPGTVVPDDTDPDGLAIISISTGGSPVFKLATDKASVANSIIAAFKNLYH